MEGMGRGMFNICGEHKTYAVFQRSWEQSWFYRLILAEQKVNLVVLINPGKQILYLECEIIHFFEEAWVLGYDIPHQCPAGASPWVLFHPCAAWSVSEALKHCGPLALLMFPAKQTFLQDGTQPLLWPHVPVLPTVATWSCVKPRCCKHSAGAEWHTGLMALASKHSEAVPGWRKTRGKHFLSPWESAGP